MGRTENLRKPAMAILIFLLVVNVGFVLASGLPWDGKNPVARVDLAEEDIFNANRTGHDDVNGFNSYLRNLAGQGVHSNFQLNTNSCASCHMTHTGQGDQLLFQASVYNTCTACHFDTTMGAYNILTGEDREKKPAGGGRFYDGDFGIAERNGASFHLATGLKSIGDAPGADLSRAGWWNKSFTCGSCHAPHGSYSGRHMQFNPNGQAERFTNITLVAVDGEEDTYRPAPSYHEQTPWLYYDRESVYGSVYGVEIKNGNNTVVTDEFFVHYRDGYVQKTGDPGPGPYRITFSRAMVVDIEVIPAVIVNNQVMSDEQVIYRSGIVNFCTACHTGYLEEVSMGGEAYLYTRHASFEHPINMDITGYVADGFIEDPDPRFKLETDRPWDGSEERLVCLSCHFAHGTDAGLILDKNFTLMYTGENAPSQTHLLRFGGRQSCMVCHKGMPSGRLTVESTEPVDGATTDAPPPQILVTFDRRVDMGTLSGNVSVYDSGSQQVVPGTFSTVDYRTVVFTPNTPLEEGKDYTVDLTTAIRSWFGRTLNSLYRFIFTVPGTEPEGEPLVDSEPVAEGESLVQSEPGMEGGP